MGSTLGVAGADAADVEPEGDGEASAAADVGSADDDDIPLVGASVTELPGDVDWEGPGTGAAATQPDKEAATRPQSSELTHLTYRDAVVRLCMTGVYRPPSILRTVVSAARWSGRIAQSGADSATND